MTSGEGEYDAFWDSMVSRLEGAALDLEVKLDEFYSQPEWSIFRVHYSAMDGYRLFAWLSVPRRLQAGKIPALLWMPDYGSDHDILYTPIRAHAVVMNATHRGQRGSDTSFQASYPGLLTEGIDRPDTYVMLDVFADALRGVQAVLAQQEAEIGPVAVTGSGLGGALALAAAAQWSQVTAVASDTPLALGHPDVLDVSSGYPLGELHDYLRVYPHRRESVLANAAPLDPVKMAPKVGVPVLLSLGRRDRGQCPLAIGEELAGRLPNCDLRVYDGGSEGGGHPHGVVRAAWLKEQLGIS